MTPPDPRTDDPIDHLTAERPQAFAWLLEGSQRVVAAVEADLKSDHNLALSELEVLIQLAKAPDGLRPRILADRCVMTTGGCTRLLDRLEAQGMVERRPHRSDRRGLVVVLTADGRRLLASTLPGHYDSLDRHLWSALSDRELRQLAAIMEKVGRQLADPSDRMDS